MIGKQERWQEDLFVAGPLSSLVPDDHILKRLAAVFFYFWRFTGRPFAAKRIGEWRRAVREKSRGKAEKNLRKRAA